VLEDFAIFTAKGTAMNGGRPFRAPSRCDFSALDNHVEPFFEHLFQSPRQ